MKKIIAAFAFLLFGASVVHAIENDYGERRISSFSDVATVGPVMFASGPIHIQDMILSSGAPNGFIAFFRSTSSVFTNDIATQTRINCGFFSTNTNPNSVNIDIYNDSYTYVQRAGTCEITFFFSYPEWKLSNPVGFTAVDCSTCPASPVSPNNVGLSVWGQR